MPDQSPLPPRRPRVPTIVPRGPGQVVRRVGLRTSWRSDLYHRALTLRWWEFNHTGVFSEFFPPLPT